MNNEIKQFVDQMMPAFNQGYKQWHEKEWKEFISQVRNQFKQELIDELGKFDDKLDNSAEFRAGIDKAIEIIKNK